MFDLFSRYFWLLGLATSALNAATVWVRSRSHVREYPALASDYATVIRAYLTWFMLPWLVMGYGMTIGGVPTIWHYFRPQDGGPYVLAWYGANILLAAVVSLWLARGGAEIMAGLPAAYRSVTPLSANSLRLIGWVSLVGTVAMLPVLWFADVPIPPLR